MDYANKAEIIANLEAAKAGTNPAFAIAFAIDNNPQAIMENLRAIGVTIQDTDELGAKQAMYKAIASIADAGQIELCNQALDAPYLNDAPNYTAGYRDWFTRNTQGTAQDRNLAQGRNMAAGRTDFSWGGLLAALGAGLGVYANSAMQQGSLSGPQLSPEQLAAIEAEKKKQEEEAAKKKKQQLYWIAGGSAFLLILIIILIVSLRNKKSAA